MLGAIIGDISGSRFEWENLKSKDFELLTYRCHPTDDSNMTLAVAQALLQSRGDWSQLAELAIASMRELGRKYPRGYGGRFKQWLLSENPQPYGSWGNGSAMAYVPVPKDLTRVKSKFLFNLTKRQVVCFGLGALVGLPVFFLTKGAIGVSMAAALMIVIMLPFFLFAMFERNGQPLEVLLKHYIQARFIRPRTRVFETENFYATLEQNTRNRREVRKILHGKEKRKA